MKKPDSYEDVKKLVNAEPHMAQAYENVSIAAWAGKMICTELRIGHEGVSVLAQTIMEERARLERSARHA